ncbi:MAG: hypothetical protein KAT30_08120 [Candidatus Krumholzibacteria bacterium]|nr:hypothetical protein [Candidatus Krumholzibacteria bacterium]
MYGPRAIVKNLKPLLLGLLVMSAAAHGARADSKYALVFLGERLWAGDVRAISLGSNMQLVEDSLALQYNPATLSSARKFTFGITGYFTMDKGKSADYEETDASSKVSSFVVGFPIMSRISLGLGYRGKTDATANFVTERETEDGDEYGEFFNRSGGLTSFPMYAAVRVARYLQLGGYFSVERGTFENRWDIIFANPTWNPATSSQVWSLTGTGFGFGVVIKAPGRVSLGATYDSDVEYDTRVEERFTNPISDKNYKQTTLVPERWTFSGAWQFHRLFSIYGTYSTSDFTQFVGLSFPQDRLYREEMMSGGFEYLKGVPIAGARIPIRVGGTYIKQPYDSPTGSRIETILFEFGLGLKLRSGRGKIDLALQGGTTGDLANNLIENRMFRVYVGINGAEIWQRHRQDDF